MSDLKNWYSGDGSYISSNYGPVFLLNSHHNVLRAFENGNSVKYSTVNKNDIINDNTQITTEQLTANSIEISKLFIMEYRTSKWQLYIDDYLALKSIICILLDQSLDLGIDNNPLMLDLTISEHLQQNRNKKFNTNALNTFNGNLTKQNFKLLASKTSSRSVCDKPSKNHEKSSISLIPAVSSVSGCIDAELSSDCYTTVNDAESNSIIKPSQSETKIQYTTSNANSNTVNNGLLWMNSFYYAKEFEQLQALLLWFPEEVAYKLTEIEYELFKSVQPIEYLRHVSLDMANFKVTRLTLLKTTTTTKTATSPNIANTNQTTPTVDSNNDNTKAQNKTVQDLILRYKEVSSWIKKLIQLQESPDKRLAITLSCIRCAITCWNIGNFNSAREIWLGLK